jgi:hypothetical protein
MKLFFTLLIYGLLSVQAFSQASMFALAALFQHQPECVQITNQPDDVYACAGQPVDFSIKIMGNATRIQWQSSTNSVHWVNLEGEYAELLKGLRKVTYAHNGLYFRAVVYGADGTQIHSKTARLHVEGKIYCTKQPESALIVENGRLYLEAEFSTIGDAPCQWQYSPYGTGTWFDLDGETKPILQIENVKTDQSGGAFRVIARNPAGCDTTTSKIAYMEVVSRPIIEINRGQAAHCGGTSTTFSIKMRGGSGREQVQWQESRDYGKTFRNIPGAREMSYTVKRIQEDMADYKYRAFVQLPGNIELFTSEAKLTVHGAVVFQAQPQSKFVCPGDAIDLQIKIEANGSAPEYIWQASTDGEFFQDIPTSRNEALSLTSNSTDKGVRYFRAVVNGGTCTSMISEVAKITLLDSMARLPNLKFEPTTVTNQNAQIICDFLPDAETYQAYWQYTENSTDWKSIPCQGKKSLDLKHADTKRKNRKYRLKLQNKVCDQVVYSNAVYLGSL